MEAQRAGLGLLIPEPLETGTLRSWLETCCGEEERMLVGVDIGGTFTDFCLSTNGSLQIHKVLSTPQDPAQAMLAGLAALSPVGLSAIERISHGSTVATNAILERKGAATALIATLGFRDLLAIGRQNRPLLYALQPRLPQPLIPRRWCYEVPERLDYAGTVLAALDLAALDAILDDIALQGIDSVAVCLLYSYVNPVHERAVRARILERGLLREEQIALSCEVLPEFREYERASTVALEAYVRPVVGRYLRHLEERLPTCTTLRIMKSDGGVMSSRRARSRAVQTVLSGPAAGAIGGFHVAQLAGYDRVITLDMGGTSTDVALCPGALVRRTESEIDGLPLRTQLLDIQTIGAGGGSIARLDAGGVLQVGPQSAGADPGPIVYGRGGRQVTVTDANCVLGRLDADHFLGGAMALYVEPARTALRSLAGQMGLSAETAALGIVHVANTNVDRALRRVSVARGYDPREFTLLAFGGAGPLHACHVASQLQIPRVLIPRYPGVLCAFGLLMADVVVESTRSVLGPLTAETQTALEGSLAEMVAQARQDLQLEGIAEQDMVFAAFADVRYQGQAYELTVPFSPQLLSAFHAAHARRYGHAMVARAVEVVSLRLQATGLVSKPQLAPEPLPGHDIGRSLLKQALLGCKPVICDPHDPVDGAGPQEIPQAAQVALYDRACLPPGARFPGPALVFQVDSTVFVPPDWLARVDGYHNLVLER